MNFTGLEKISDATRIPICVYLKGENIFQFPDKELYSSYFDTEKASLLLLNEMLEAKKVPLLFMEDGWVYYGAFLADGYTVLLGPSARETVSKSRLQHFQVKHDMKKEPLIPRISGRRLTCTLSLVYYAFTGEDFDAYRIHIANSVGKAMEWETEAAAESYELEQSEYDRDHNSLEFERKLLKMVRDGDVAAMDHFLHSQLALENEHIGVLAKDENKQAEYMCVAMLTLLARTAAEGGMVAEKAYSLADVYLQKISQVHDPADMLSLTARAQYEFTAEVKAARESDSNLNYIEAAKSFVAANLRRPFQIGEIAPAIGINRTYLASKFSEAEGITLQQYVVRERCIHAANLLKHSDLSIALIAEYFCFSSQSHFGKAFKEYSGMTPKEYRNRYKKN